MHTLRVAVQTGTGGNGQEGVLHKVTGAASAWDTQEPQRPYEVNHDVALLMDILNTTLPAVDERCCTAWEHETSLELV